MDGKKGRERGCGGCLERHKRRERKDGWREKDREGGREGIEGCGEERENKGNGWIDRWMWWRGWWDVIWNGTNRLVMDWTGGEEEADEADEECAVAALLCYRALCLSLWPSRQVALPGQPPEPGGKKRETIDH